MIAIFIVLAMALVVFRLGGWMAALVAGVPLLLYALLPFPMPKYQAAESPSHLSNYPR